MQVRNIIVVAFAIALALLGTQLMVEIQGTQSVVIDEAAFDEMLREYRRQELRASGAPSARRTVSRAGKKSFAARKSVPQEPLQERRTRSRTEIVDDEDTRDIATRMNDANARYDQGDYEGAIDEARQILDRDSKNVRMLRILVSSNCILGDRLQAVRYYADLPRRDQGDMRIRCERYGIEFDK